MTRPASAPRSTPFARFEPATTVSGGQLRAGIVGVLQADVAVRREQDPFDDRPAGVLGIDAGDVGQVRRQMLELGRRSGEAGGGGPQSVGIDLPDVTDADRHEQTVAVRHREDLPGLALEAVGAQRRTAHPELARHRPLRRDRVPDRVRPRSGRTVRSTRSRTERQRWHHSWPDSLAHAATATPPTVVLPRADGGVGSVTGRRQVAVVNRRRCHIGTCKGRHDAESRPDGHSCHWWHLRCSVQPARATTTAAPPRDGTDGADTTEATDAPDGTDAADGRPTHPTTPSRWSRATVRRSPQSRTPAWCAAAPATHWPGFAVLDAGR